MAKRQLFNFQNNHWQRGSCAEKYNDAILIGLPRLLLAVVIIITTLVNFIFQSQ